ncbi:hypothetical protein [uncultured Tenacibaculum sp.]|uniref:helix-turn-helix transcriptional regulator n=1 Tax=uncultured Tenacibaculum sp. TaxID=174713 RepID=UPI00260E0662|nr:hypothetical protein [uncultured Tenacibaculum sp.]
MKRSIYFLVFFSFLNSYSQDKTERLLKKLDENITQDVRIAVLDTLTNEMIRSNHPQQLLYLQQYVDLNLKIEDYDQAAQKSRFVIQNYINRGSLDSASYTIKSLLQYKGKFKKKSSEAHILLKRAAYFYNKEQLDSAALDYDRSGTLFLASKDSIFAADSRFFAGQVYFDQNDFLNSVRRFEEAYELYNKLGDASYANYALNELSSLYGKNGFHDKAIYERKRILAGAKAMKDPLAISYAYSHLFTSNIKKNEINEARKYLDSLTVACKEIKNEKRQNGFNIQVSKLNTKYYLKTKNLDSMYKHLKDFENKLKASGGGNQFNKNAFLSYSGQYHKAKSEYRLAEKFYKKLLDKDNRLGDVQLKMQANKQLSEVLAAQNKLEESYQYLKAYTQAKDAEERRITTNTFLYYQSEFETERKDNEIFKNETEIALLEKDRKLNEAKRNILWIVLIAVLLLSAVAIYLIWLRGNLKRKALAKKLEKNQNDLEEFTNQLLEKSKVQESLTQELAKLKEEIGEQKSIVKIQDLTATRILTSEDWYVFKEKFTKVHPTFFVKLKDKGYKLTKSEERLLAMEKLYLDTKQIASMLAISDDSVVRSRSRLRKKVNAPKGSSILEYLEAS